MKSETDVNSPTPNEQDDQENADEKQRIKDAEKAKKDTPSPLTELVDVNSPNQSFQWRQCDQVISKLLDFENSLNSDVNHFRLKVFMIISNTQDKTDQANPKNAKSIALSNIALATLQSNIDYLQKLRERFFKQVRGLKIYFERLQQHYNNQQDQITDVKAQLQKKNGEYDDLKNASEKLEKELR